MSVRAAVLRGRWQKDPVDRPGTGWSLSPPRTYTALIQPIGPPAFTCTHQLSRWGVFRK
ncbi:hypothetical protein [Streptomyces sp. ME18-1-4]|uniref:hypothetical protein n=1 Tax=Streptomyces sp. ME18-1-4 TaxID=3028685 RepID=UPI0029ADF60F|nr:hypothetical protein [Streptomyces sp. ME18-1-4]MDX3248424.1 hypothetical protein [Streptomyces sp. ME18-1-4]